MARWIFELLCPRCGKEEQLTTENNDLPTVNCGDCLMNDMEITEFKVVKATVDVSSGPTKGFR